VQLQLLHVDELLKLGSFSKSEHTGLEFFNRDGEAVRDDKAEAMWVIKTSHRPDSSNVFLRCDVREPCFAEFHVVKTGDEMSVGVTYDQETVERLSGFGNLQVNTTWVYSKRKSMPEFLEGGQRTNAGGAGIREGDRVAVFVNPEAREVRFYNNGVLVRHVMQLPEFSGKPLKIYCMLDDIGDEIAITRFGANEPYIDVAFMAQVVRVNVHGLSGDTLQLEVDESDTVGSIQAMVAESWSLELESFQLLHGETVPKLIVCIGTLLASAGEAVQLQLLHVDELLKLGSFSSCIGPAE